MYHHYHHQGMLVALISLNISRNPTQSVTAPHTHRKSITGLSARWKMRILPSSGRVYTVIWLHHLYCNEALREKRDGNYTRKLSGVKKKVLTAALQKTTAVRPLISNLTNHLIVGWLFGFYGISTFVGYLTPNLFLCKQFYFKQFSLA